MIGLILAAHGHFGRELLEAVEHIMGGIDNVEVVTQNDEDGRNELIEKIEEKIVSMDLDQGVLVLTELFGSTLSNVVLSLLEKYRGKKIRVVTGMNLPMLMELAINRNIEDLDQLASRIENAGLKSIKNIGSNN